MNELNNNTATGGNNDAEIAGKTFTQEQLNAIIGERLQKERQKAELGIAEKEQELIKRELHLSAKELLTEKNLPMQLLDALNCTNKETLEKSISIIDEIINQKLSEAHKNIKLKGVVPAPSFGIDELGADTSIRKAMGLPK